MRPDDMPEYTAANANALLRRIRDALGTGEIGDNLVAVARDAARAESILAAQDGRLCCPHEEGCPALAR